MSLGGHYQLLHQVRQGTISPIRQRRNQSEEKQNAISPRVQALKITKVFRTEDRSCWGVVPRRHESRGTRAEPVALLVVLSVGLTQTLRAGRVGSAGSKAWARLTCTRLGAAKHWALGLTDYDLLEKALQECDEFPRGQIMAQTEASFS